MAMQDPALLDRARRAERIVRNPEQYKVCMGCDSIVAKKVSICPNCHSYRYDADEKVVVDQARLLSQREKHSVIAEDLL
jgi:hypothetical protein